MQTPPNHSGLYTRSREESRTQLKAKTLPGKGDWLLPPPNLYSTRMALVITYMTLTFAFHFTVCVLANFFKIMPGE
jgi:hypothetical protein